MAELSHDLRSIDPRMAVVPVNRDGLAWHLPFETPMRLFGFPWFDQDHAYDRLPLARPAEVTQFPNGVKTMVSGKDCVAYLLSCKVAGGQVRFRTDSARFAVEAEEFDNHHYDNITATGSMGMDLYLKEDDRWVCLGVTRRNPAEAAFSAEIAKGIRREMHDVILHLPSCSGIRRLFIGLEETAHVEPPTPFAAPEPVVWYGTSIVQGVGATRPGLLASNLLSRLLNREVLNQGYAGGGKGEPEIAEMLAAIPNPALYLIDYAWNVGLRELQATLPGLLDTLHRKHPAVPLLLVSPTPGADALKAVLGKTFDLEGETKYLRETCQARRVAGDRCIFFFDAFHEGLGEDFWEGLVDGVHLNDLGNYRLANAIFPIVKALL
ncbi:MAG: hypothetical protein J6Y80_02025 [Victivallales bacterium]|nr:hypothetical protein [Victivallales bacterium]